MASILFCFFFGLLALSWGTDYVNYLDSELDIVLLQQNKYDIMDLVALEMEYTFENGPDSFTHLYSIEYISYFFKASVGFASYFGSDSLVEDYFDISQGVASSPDPCSLNGLCLTPSSEISSVPSGFKGSLFEVDDIDSIESINYIEIFLDSKRSVGYNFQISYSIGFSIPNGSEIIWFDAITP
jgi:hypothetical protein